MKSFRLAIVTLGVSALTASALPVRAQEPPGAPPAPAPSPVPPTLPPGRGPGGRGGPGGGMGQRALENLTPDEQARLQAARRATARDPAVVAARRALMQAERDAMLRQDPALGPVLDKLRPGGEGGGPGGARRAPLTPPAEDNDRALAMLTPDERTRLANAQRAARTDATVISARQAMGAATTPEARRAARQAMREALRAAMLRTDVGIDAILEKVGRGGGRA